MGVYLLAIMCPDENYISEWESEEDLTNLLCDLDEQGCPNPMAISYVEWDELPPRHD